VISRADGSPSLLIEIGRLCRQLRVGCFMSGGKLCIVWPNGERITKPMTQVDALAWLQRQDQNIRCAEDCGERGRSPTGDADVVPNIE
jgi:hypothetical protein